LVASKVIRSDQTRAYAERASQPAAKRSYAGFEALIKLGTPVDRGRGRTAQRRYATRRFVIELYIRQRAKKRVGHY
jgi:hypothetical protein